MGCKYAQWRRSSNGRLHSSGDGRCMYPYEVPPLPSSMYWVSMNIPKPCGGCINRRETLKESCIYYTLIGNEEMVRYLGKTTQQLSDAPVSAIYVWCNSDVSYPKHLAQKLQRTDLFIVNPSWLTEYRWRGQTFNDVIIDHALDLTLEQSEALMEIRFRCIRSKKIEI